MKRTSSSVIVIHQLNPTREVYPEFMHQDKENSTA